ncbi:MAG: 16S rRNA (uracil(1498)-N(3))-methyltransferase [Beijerinckiaceae bacterium]
MARYDFTAHRLYVDAPLSRGAAIALTRAQAHYLINVLRLPAGAEILVFNGKDGEWRSALATSGRKSVSLSVLEMTRPQTAAYDLHYLFAPLKQARLDYMVQKAVEMGAGVLQPVLTRHTHIERLSVERMRANAIEAAEQCGILTLPRIAPLIRLDSLLAAWPREGLLVFCDENAHADPVATLAVAKAAIAEKGSARHLPLAVLIGPEGGFDAAEREKLLALPNVVRLSLGPRILRADTAAVAALALVQAALGDWGS